MRQPTRSRRGHVRHGGPGLAVTLSAVTATASPSEPSAIRWFELDELATSIISVAVDEFEFVGGDGAPREVRRRTAGRRSPTHDRTRR